ETRDLRPLEPRYVSTVDSGNLAGHLIVLGNACWEMMERPLDSGEALRGIEDALLLSQEAASQLTDDRRSQTVTRTNLDEAIGALATSLAEPEASPAEWAARLRHLGTLADTLVDVARTFAAERGDGDDAAVLVWTRATHAAIQSHLRDVDASVPSSAAGRALGRRLSDIRRLCREMFAAMDFEFLFDPARKIFSIGYRVHDGSLDPAAYDLLASEARLASFIAIAKGEVPASHWFRLARPMTPVELAGAGARGSLGFYEALDYTRTRLPEGTEVAVVRAYMAHHQGMTLVALTNVLRSGAMRARFHAETIVQATELLLQERAPRSVAVTRPRVDEVKAPAQVRDFVEPIF